MLIWLFLGKLMNYSLNIKTSTVIALFDSKDLTLMFCFV